MMWPAVCVQLVLFVAVNQRSGVLGILLKTNIEPAIAKASIYKQNLHRLNSDGLREQTLDTVVDLPTKTDVKVIVHGFRASRTDASIKPLANAYLAAGYENVLMADWHEAADMDYATSRSAVDKVATHFARILADFFAAHNVAVSDVHVVGHSLGAHIAGNIGKWFNGSLGRITGLDPALPLFRPHDPDSLQPTDARYTDVVHTDYPVFGDWTPRGSADFYPNFGHASQPGCDEFDLVTLSRVLFDSYSCSHNRAVLLYAESIGQPKNFPAIPCSWNGVRQRSVELCIRDRHLDVPTINDQIAAMQVDGGISYMGEHVTNNSLGIYYLPTYEASPYGMGVNTQI